MAVQQAQLDELGFFLEQHQTLWHPRPFTADKLPWEQDHPSLAKWLAALPTERIDELEPTGSKGDDLHPEFVELQRRTFVYGQLPTLHVSSLPPVSRRARWKIPGRKLDQIRQLLPILGEVVASSDELVEWCAGKGHLGRVASLLWDMPTHLLERCASVAAAGMALHERARSRCHYTICDVLTNDAASALHDRCTVVGLHACGELGERMLIEATKAKATGICLVPCCPHVGGPDRLPMSRSSTFVPDKVALRLSIADEVVAGRRHRQHRRREMVWRKAADLMLRRATGEDVYRPLGPLPRHWFHEALDVFCARIARRHGVVVPTSFRAGPAELEAVETVRRGRGRALVRGLFRRPLERWLALDRACFVAERGYDVRVGTFCRPRDTPRNVVIVARPTNFKT